ncbi:MAG: 50S ribosomal protein L30 [Eubacteriales bacterium]
MEQIKIVLTGSLIGAKPKQKATAASLGLRKIGDCAIGVNDAALAGKITVLKHLIQVEPVSAESK